MQPFRKNVAIAIDGGGIKGIIVTRALARLEQALGKPCRQIFQLATGTSTGSIISAGIGRGLSAQELYELYVSLGEKIFPQTLRSKLWPLFPYRYPAEPLHDQLEQRFHNMKMGDFARAEPPMDVVITTFDLQRNHTCFVKPYKDEYKDWPVLRAVLGSCTVPTYFPVVENRYVDGGVGSYANPCYLAAYEAAFCLKWDPAETTLISLGTGRSAHTWEPGRANRRWVWEWIGPVLGAFLQSADDQQVQLVRAFFDRIDFRRFQVDLRQPIEMDDPTKISELSAYGDEMGNMILSDIYDQAPVNNPILPSAALMKRMRRV